MIKKPLKVLPDRSARQTGKIVGVTRNTDMMLGWVAREYPQLEAWRVFAVEWLKGETNGITDKLQALALFFEKYIIKQSVTNDPAVFLARSTILPDFYRTACPDSAGGIRWNNHIHIFLNFILLRHFSIPPDFGDAVVSPAYHNPVARRSKSSLPKLDESIHSPLPYGYIDELRLLLVSGPHFSDWRWAQNVLGTEIGRMGHTAPDWFPVTEAQIDRDDPDCVWRERSTTTGVKLEIWSPVRWVALLVKLILPLRTFQVRMLDSGEADTWRYQEGNWVLNTYLLAQGSERRPVQQGVFRRSKPLTDGETVSTVLYINTNKTADIAKSGSDKGYVVPWILDTLVHQNAFYWLEKVRNWQQKYNPLNRRTAWTELDARHILAKSEIQLASCPDTCFLFRLPENRANERSFPVTQRQLDRVWYALLESLELRLANKKETHYNGTSIRLLPPQEERTGCLKTLFPLHSLRVSLITALALEGKVSFPILQKLVGHSRLLMTLYYTKPGASRINEILIGASEKLNANKEASIQNFLQDTEHHHLLQQAICNSSASLAAAIPQHPAARNPAGWMPMHHGLCLVGGNTSEVQDNDSVGGCYNGGPNIGSTTVPKHSVVPGGSRNCVRCRWFVTEPHYLPALAAHFNTLAYHFDEARNACLARENELQDLKKQKADAEDAGQPFARLGAYRQAERVWESAMKYFSDLAEDLVACWRLIERCKTALTTSQDDDGTQLVTVGTVGDVNIVFEETESEQLQLAGVCENVEVYPDLEPGKAVLRRSQLLDAVLYRNDLPPMFMLLNEQEQLLTGNAFMRHLAQQMNPSNPALGQREVIRLMDAGVRLSQHFDMDLSSLLPKPVQTLQTGSQTLLGDEA